MCLGFANQFSFSLVPAWSHLPTLPPRPLHAVIARALAILLLYAKSRRKLALSAPTSITGLPTDVLTKATRKGVIRSPF